MKILLTGGGTGGHFYPIVAVAEELNALARENRISDMKLYYMAPTPYDNPALYENNIIFRKNVAGKFRRYFSILNFLDFFKTIWGTFVAIFKVFMIFPDVVFGKGGYVSFPPLFAARFFGIPVIVHESDTVPGRLNVWAGKFAVRVAVSYPEASKYFPQAKVAVTGNPIRRNLLHPVKDGAREHFQLPEQIPVIFVLGGSLGSQYINEKVIEALPTLLQKYYVIHQTGRNNFASVKALAQVVLSDSQYKDRYKPIDFLNDLDMRMAAAITSLVITRAGSTIFEISTWGLPSIVVPISNSNGDHQRENAYSYARSGAAVVIEEQNLSANLLASEVSRIVDIEEVREKMKSAALTFNQPDAARKIAEELFAIAMSHQ